jgi:hypothetical protein
MDIVAALFIEDMDVRTPVAGGPTHIDLSGVHFSAVAPAPPPLTMTPHLVVIIRCDATETGSGVLEVVFDWEGEQVARNVQPLQVEPGKFTFRLVRAELELPGYGTVLAHCRVDAGAATIVPYSLVPAPSSQ